MVLVIEAGGNGGTEVYVEGLARYMAVHGEVRLVALRGELSALQDRFPGLSVAVTGGAAGLRAEARAHPEAVFSLHLYSSLLPAVRVLRGAGARVVTTLHQPLGPWNIVHRMRWRIAVAFSHAVVGVSSACMQGYGPLLRGKLVEIASGPLPLEILPPARPPVSLDPGSRFEVMFVGRLSREKDLQVLIRAAAHIRSARLTLIGDGPERARLMQEAAEQGIDIRFAGALPREQVFAELAQAHAFVLPSRFEGLGLAAIEAMALGVPTITANFPAAADYIRPRETGLTFARGDSNALADCLEQLRVDEALRIRLSENGAYFVRQKFFPDTQFGKMLNILAAL